MNLHIIDGTQVALHAYSDALVVSSEADAEREALEGLFQMSLATEAQLSDAMDGTIVRMQNANNELMGRFQGVFAMNTALSTEIIGATSRAANLTHVAQAQQEAFDNQLQHMQRQIAQLEQEKAEMLRRHNEELASAARRQEEAMQAASEAARAQIEALNLAHASALVTRDTTYANATTALTQIHITAIQTLTNTHTTAFTALQSELTQANHNHQEAVQNAAHKEEEIKLLKTKSAEMQRLLQIPLVRKILGPCV